jgi:hypothetical protein
MFVTTVVLQQWCNTALVFLNAALTSDDACGVSVVRPLAMHVGCVLVLGCKAPVWQALPLPAKHCCVSKGVFDNLLAITLRDVTYQHCAVLCCFRHLRGGQLSIVPVRPALLVSGPGSTSGRKGGPLSRAARDQALLEALREVSLGWGVGPDGGRAQWQQLQQQQHGGGGHCHSQVDGWPMIRYCWRR